MTQRLARRSEDRFITTLQEAQDPQRRGLLDVSIVTRFPVIGSRMVMRQSSPAQAQEKRAMPGLDQLQL